MRKNSVRLRRSSPLNQPRRRSFRPIVEKLEARLAPANIDVLSYHYDQSLTGQNVQETLIHPGPAGDPTALNTTNYRTLFSQPIDGQAYAQPLYRAALPVPGLGTHNVAFIATEHDGVYAVDADSPTGGPDPMHPGQFWYRSFIDRANGITMIPYAELSTPDLFPKIGITDERLAVGPLPPGIILPIQSSEPKTASLFCRQMSPVPLS